MKFFQDGPRKLTINVLLQIHKENEVVWRLNEEEALVFLGNLNTQSIPLLPKRSTRPERRPGTYMTLHCQQSPRGRNRQPCR